MSMNEKWMKLQFFAEGASGGDGGGEGSATGVEAPADAGQGRTLESLGVPKAKAEKYRARTKAKQQMQQPAAQTATAQAEPLERDAAADAGSQQNQQPEQSQTAQKLSWDELMKDADYSKEMQNTVSKVLNAERKKNGDAAADLEALRPMIEMLAPRYGQTEGKLDYKALAEAVTNDKRFYESKAAELGTSPEIARELETLRRAEEQRKQASAEAQKQQEYDQHMANLRQQAEELKKQFPQFDLDTEMLDPAFKRMVGPYIKMSVEQAYHAKHYKEIKEAQAAAVAQQVSATFANSVKSGQMPAENGRGGRSSGAAVPKPYSEYTPAERKAFKEHIYREAAYGRKVPLR